MNALLIQQIYPDTPGVEMLKLTEARHAEYCKRYGFDYMCLYENPVPEQDPLKGSWGKVRLISDALYDGYDYVVWLDADTLIVDFDADLRDAVVPFHIGACWHRIPQLNHWNVGALYIDNCQETRDFFDKWLTTYPGTTGWLEQGEFNTLAMRNKTVVTVSDKWNSTIDVSAVPDAVVLGFHGQGDTAYRINLMRDTMQTLSEQKASTTQDTSEVNNVNP
jgi:hypothetical protein